MRRYYVIIVSVVMFLLASCDSRQEKNDQGRTASCWIYAMCACIEHESVLRGDSIALSRQWLIARYMQEQTEELWQQNNNDSHSPAEQSSNPSLDISLRGVGPEALRLIDLYGLVPYQHEETHINNGTVFERKLRLMARQSRSVAELRKRMKEVMPEFSIADNSFDPPTTTLSASHSNKTSTQSTQSTAKQSASQTPVKLVEPVALLSDSATVTSQSIPSSAFYYYSFRYTPQLFAESVMYCLRYGWYAYDGSKPIGTSFVLDVPDNHRRHRYVNMTYKEQLRKVIQSVNEGHAVYWEYGKDHSSGHAMAIVGLRKGKDGKPYLLCLNSYGSSWGENGYCLISMKYFIDNTCNIGVLL